MGSARKLFHYFLLVAVDTRIAGNLLRWTTAGLIHESKRRVVDAVLPVPTPFCPHLSDSTSLY